MKGIRNHKLANLAPLLNNNLIAYYWMGFLMADGCIANNRLTLGLSAKDKSHLLKFAKFIEFSGKLNFNQLSNFYMLKAMDATICPLIQAKFDWKPRKTYNPPSFNFKSNNDFFAFFMGFVDGDGSIGKQHRRKDCSLRIKLHASWGDFLVNCADALYKYIPTLAVNRGKVHIDAEKYAQFSCCNEDILWFLKEFGKNNNLPILKRKWSKINKPKGRYKLSSDLKEKIIKMRINGAKYKEIAKELHITISYISKIVRKRL